jgi:hypothetical protein
MTPLAQLFAEIIEEDLTATARAGAATDQKHSHDREPMLHLFAR